MFPLNNCKEHKLGENNEKCFTFKDKVDAR